MSDRLPHDEYDSIDIVILERLAAFFNTEPMFLSPPLNDILNVDALNRLYASAPGNLTITFMYGGYEVVVDRDNEVQIRKLLPSIAHSLDSGSTVLILDSTIERSLDACVEFVSLEQHAPLNVVYVTFDNITDDRIDALASRGISDSIDIQTILVGDVNHSSITAIIDEVNRGSSIRIDTVPDPTDLSALGVKISEYFHEWETVESRHPLCFLPLSRLLEHVHVQSVFRFVHIMTGLTRSTNARSLFHLAPDEHDEETLRIVEPLFDSVIDAGSTDT